MSWFRDDVQRDWIRAKIWSWREGEGSVRVNVYEFGNKSRAR